jgi:membrane associated rhomboid family serine protease/Tfp pilus assembly protein PilF
MSDQPIIIPSPTPEPFVIRRRYLPVATFILLGLNVLIFLLMELSGGSSNPDVLLSFGASYGPYIRRGEYWRLVMPMFLHIGILHLLLNTAALFVLGRILESVYGYGRFTLLYVACGMGSSFLSMTLSSSVSAGASGAIFGIAGAMLTTGYLHRAAIPRRWRRSFGGGILPLIVINLILGYSIAGIDNWGHLGGLLAGMLLSAVIPPPGLDWVPASPQDEPSQAAVIIPVLVVALAMAAAVDHYRTSRAVMRLLGESVRLRAAGQGDRALERIREASRLAPRDERPHEELGSLYLQQGQVPEAIREFEEARRWSPDSTRARLGLALAYRQKGDLANAQKMFESVFGKNPRSADGHRALADLCAEQKLYGEAIGHYQAALRLQPDDAVVHNNLAWLLATSEDQQSRNPRGALEHAQRAVTLTGWKEATFIDTLAEALYANGKFDEAVKVQTEALKLEPDNREFQEHMARYRKAAGV